MEAQRSSSGEHVQEIPGLAPEYRYIVHIRALETLTNLLRREGISIPEGSMHVSFPANTRLNMKALKDMGLIWSYSVIRVRKDEEIVEEG